ncbi:MAG: VPLPA-CTERM sorting domain-containing protein [Nitrospira sp.]|nr:VPLPA-CTERM sorting domain-containing protein [Nitrospira sp.]
MTKRTVLFAIAAMGMWLAGAAPSHAATVTTPGPATGLTYEWGVTMSETDSAVYTGLVGAKSWAEPANPPGERGWTHTSDWTALDLTGLSGSTLLTLHLARGATGELSPAFSLYSGWETVNSDSPNHTFNNIGNISWATNLTYMDHIANAGGPDGSGTGTGVTFVSKQWELAPGLYSLVYGGNPGFVPPLGQTGSHSFSATLTTSPVPVPAALWLFGSGLTALVGLARRRMNA